MKLFIVNYMDDCENETYLTVGNSKEEIEKREIERLQKECSCFMYCYVFEINEVDGYKIIVK